VEVAADRAPDQLNTDGLNTEEPAAQERAVTEVSAADASGAPETSREAAVSDTTQASDTEEKSGGSETGARGRGDYHHLLVGVLAVLLVAAIVGVALFGQRVAQASQEERLRAEALTAARQMVVNFTTVDHRSFDKSTNGVLALSAGKFRQQYTNASSELERLVKENKTVSRGEVLDAGIVSFDPDSARVLVVADADVTNVAAKKPQLRTYRIQLDLSREGSGWKVVELTFVG
jgi:Mce-associated membrane protein